MPTSPSMRILRSGLFVAALLLALGLAPKAHAGFTFAASIGKAFQLSPLTRGEPTTLMVAPGWGLFESILRAELGLAVSLPDLAGGLTTVDIQLRPAVVLSPPGVPVHLRLFAVVDRLIGGVRLLPGAALGGTVALGPVGLFLEVGALPRITGAGVEWLVEPRLGALWMF